MVYPTRGLDFLAAMAEALGLDGVRRIEISGGIDEPMIAVVELLVDKDAEPGVVGAVKKFKLRVDADGEGVDDS